MATPSVSVMSHGGEGHAHRHLSSHHHQSAALIYHYLHQGLEQLNVSEPQPISMLRHQGMDQLGSDSSMSSTIVPGPVGVNASAVMVQKQYDESVFSLLTVRNAMIIVCYSLIILVSLTGNLLVCRVAFGSREMRTTTNLLIASLACSDIVMTGLYLITSFNQILFTVTYDFT